MRSQRHKTNSGERGYVLLTLIFFVAVLAISLATILPSVVQEAKRDRENELVHRGAQYERAIRLYFKKNGHYPAKIEDLENTNNIRYLRKRYKDPMAKGENGGQADFKLLHYGDPGVRLSPGGANPAAQALQAQTLANGGGGGARAGLVASALQQQNTDASQTSGTPTDGSAQNVQGQNANGNAVDGTPAGGASPGASGGAATDPSATPDPNGGNKPNENPTLGGGAMVGVVSTSVNKTIREFNKKHHYNEWQFMYDPTTDRGGLPTGPWQPPTAIGSQGIGTPAGQLNQPANSPSGNQPGAGNPAPEPIKDPQQ